MDRVKIECGDVGKLSEKENYYDLVTAVETIYFWSDMKLCFEKVRKCLNDRYNGKKISKADKSALLLEFFLRLNRAIERTAIHYYFQDAALGRRLHGHAGHPIGECGVREIIGDEIGERQISAVY